MKITLKYAVIMAVGALLCLTNVYADEDARDIAKAALTPLKVNHFAKHISLPLDQYFNFDQNESYTQAITYIKPVLPYHLSKDIDLVVRTIAPLYERSPKDNGLTGQAVSYVNGWGDINPTFFITPTEYKSVIIGLGPTFYIPTASNNQYIGAGKWSLGPELAVYSMTENWVLGFLTDNVWSFAGDAERQAVNNFQFEYLISYVFDNGIYIKSNPTITANWKAPASQQWTVPFGIGAGQTVKYQNDSINVGFLGNYNAIRPNHSASTWQLQLEVEWLLNPATFG